MKGMIANFITRFRSEVPISLHWGLEDRDMEGVTHDVTICQDECEKCKKFG